MRALFLAASPNDQARLRVDHEWKRIREEIAKGDQSDRIELEVEFAVTATDLSAALMSHRPDIVHFAGHGGAGGLFLEDESGRSTPVDGDLLRRLLAAVGGGEGLQVRCVVLNACHSAALAAPLVEVVDVVIGTVPTVTDLEAIAFATGFYRGLVNRYSVGQAFELGAIQARLEDPSAAADRAQMSTAKRIDPNTLDLWGETRRHGSLVATEDAMPTSATVPTEDIFVSKPTTLTPRQEVFWQSLRADLTARGLRLRIQGETDFATQSPLVDVLDLMKECAGCLVLGFGQLRATSAVSKPDTPRERTLGDVLLVTPWNQMEASMAYALGLPLLIIREDGVHEEGMFDRGSLPLFIHATDLSQDWVRSPAFVQPLDFWLGQVMHGRR